MPEKGRPVPTEAYHKARRDYALFAGLLIAWELVGIEVPETIPNLGIKLLNPEAVPYVLIALTVYIGYRIIIEWWHCDENLRSKTPSKVDFRVAHGLGLLALGIYFLQRLSEIRIADYVSIGLGYFFPIGGPVLVGWVAALTLLRIWVLLRRSPQSEPRTTRLAAFIIVIGAAVSAMGSNGVGEGARGGVILCADSVCRSSLVMVA